MSTPSENKKSALPSLVTMDDSTKYTPREDRNAKATEFPAAVLPLAQHKLNCLTGYRMKPRKQHDKAFWSLTEKAFSPAFRNLVWI